MNINTNVVNTAAVYNFQVLVTGQNKITAGSVITITVPNKLKVGVTSGSFMTTCITQINSVPSSFTNVTRTDCLYQSTGSPAVNTISFTVSADILNLISYTIYVGPIQNPSSCVPSAVMNSFIVDFANGYPVGTQDTGLKKSYSPGVIKGTISQSSFPTSQAGASDDYTIDFNFTNTIPQGGYLQITFPNDKWTVAPSDILTYTRIWVQGNEVTSQILLANPVTTLVVQYKDVFSTMQALPMTTKNITVKFVGIKNFNTIGTSKSFTVTTMDATKYAIDQLNAGLFVTVNKAGTILINQFISSSTIVGNPTYLYFDVTPSVLYSSGGYIEVTAPAPYVTMQSLGTQVCQPQFGFDDSSNLRFCSPSTYTLQLGQDLDYAEASQLFILYYFINPLGVLTLPSFTLSYVNPDATAVATQSTGLVYTTKAGACTVSQSTRDNGILQVALRTAVYSFQFSCDHKITSVGTVSFVFPPDQMGYTSADALVCKVYNGGSVGSTIPTCTKSVNATGFVTISINQWCTPAANGCTTFPIGVQLQGITNPGYIVPTLTSSIYVQTYNTINAQILLVDQIITNVKMVGTLTPGPISVVVLERILGGATAGLTGGTPTYRYQIQITTPIPQNGVVRIYFPAKTIYVGTGVTCASDGGVASPCNATTNIANPSQIDSIQWLGACTGATGCGANSILTIRMTGMKNHYSMEPNLLLPAYTIETVTINNYLIDQIIGGAASLPYVIPNANQLSSTLTAPVTPITVGATQSYTLVLSSVFNYLPSAANLGSMTIKFPSNNVILLTNSCSAFTSSITLTCSASIATQTLTINSPSQISTGTSITVQMINNVQNPPTGAPSNPFLISTFYSTYLIDQNLITTVTCDTPNLVQNVVSKRKFPYVNNLVDLTICFQTTNPIPTGAKIVFSIPDDQQVLSGAAFTTSPATPVVAGSPGTPVQAAWGAHYQNYTVTTWCDSILPATCAPTNQQCLIISTGFQNPANSQVADNSIVISVRTSTGYMIDEISIGVYTIPYVSLGPLNLLSFTRDLQTVGLQTIFTVPFTTNDDLTTTSQIFISFPVDFFFLKVAQGALTCTIQRVGGTVVSTPCSITDVQSPSNMGRYVQSMTSNMKCSSINCLTGSFIFVITGLSNPHNIQYLSGGIITVATQSKPGTKWNTINSLYYQIWKILPLSLTQFQFPDYTANLIVANTLTRSNNTVDQISQVTFSITLPTRLEAKGVIQIAIPTSQFVLNGISPTYSAFKLGVYQPATTLQQISSNGTYTVFQIQEWCSGAGFYCADGTTLQFIIKTGLSNVRYVKSPLTYIIISSYTSDYYLVDQILSGAQLKAFDDVIFAITNFGSISLTTNYVARTNQALTIKAFFGATLQVGDVITVAFNQNFILKQTAATALTATEVVSNQAFSPSTFNFNPAAPFPIVSAILTLVTNMCPSVTGCSQTQNLKIQINNVMNLLDSSAYQGQLTLSVSTSAGDLISTNSINLFDTTMVANLVPDLLLNPAVVRMNTQQGQTSDYKILFTTPGILLGGSTIEFQFPFDSILVKTIGTPFKIMYPLSISSNFTFSSPAPTITIDNVNNLYLVSFSVWNCSTGNYCPAPIALTIFVSDSKNPYIQTTTYSDFLIQYRSPAGALIYKSDIGLKAQPLLVYGNITNIGITQQPNSYVGQKTGYTFIFTTEGDIPQNGKIKIDFPLNRTYRDTSTSMTCTFNGSTSVTPIPVPTWTNPTTSPVLNINVTNICTTAPCPAGTFMVVCTGNMKNPPYVKKITPNFTISTTSSNNYIVDQGTITNLLVPQITPQPIPVTVTRQSVLLSASTIYQVQFTIVNPIPLKGYVYISMPLDQVRLPTDTPTCTSAQFQAMFCEYVDDNPNEVWFRASYNQFCGGVCTPGSVITILLSGTYNPSFLSANNAISSWKLFTANNSGDYIDGIATGIIAQPPLQGYNAYLISTTLVNPTVYAKTNLKIKMKAGTFMDTDAIFELAIPDGLFTDTGLTQCQVITFKTIQFYCSFTTNATTGYLSKVVLKYPCPFTCDATTSYVFSIPVRNRGDVKPVIGDFVITTKYSYMDVGMGSLANYLSHTPGQIIDYYVQNKGCTQVDAVCTLWFSFTQLNPIPIDSKLGRIQILLPPELTPISSSCNFYLSSNSYSSKCTVGINSRIIYATHQFTGTPMQNYNITIQIQSIRNPGSTAPTSSFTIYTQAGYVETTSKKVTTTNYYMIDQNISGMFYQITKPTPFKQVNVYRDAMSNKNGYLTGQPTKLTFEITLKHVLSQTAQFQFKLPDAAQVMFSPTTTGYSCYSVDTSYKEQNVLLCTYQPDNETVVVQNLCYVQECSQGSTVRFKVYDDFIQNYYYVVTPLNSTRDSLEVYSTTNDGYYQIDGTTTGVFVTPALQPNYLIMPSPEIIRTGNVVYQNIQWIINFKINKNPVPGDGYITIQVPQGVLFLQDELKLQISDLDSNSVYSNVTYSQYSADSSINLITIYQFCNKTNVTYGTGIGGWPTASNSSLYITYNCSIGSGYSIQFSNIKNPPAQILNNQTIVVQTYTKEGYIIERGITPDMDHLFSQLIPLKITRVQILPLSPIPNAITEYEIIISQDGVAFSKNDTVLLEFPEELTLLNTTLAYSRLLATSNQTTAANQMANTRCRSVFEPWIKIKCYVEGFNKLRVFGLLTNPNMHYGLYVNYIQNPSINLTTSPLHVSVQNSLNLSIASRTTQTRIVIYPIIEANANCSKVCNTCAGSNSTCTSCTVPSAYPILKDYSCMDTCGDGYFFDQAAMKCFPCHDSCKTCYGPGNNKCFACSDVYVFQNGKCLTSCDAGTLLNKTNNQCESPSSSCSSNCKRCSANTSYCLECYQNKGSSQSVLDPLLGKCIANSDASCNNTISNRFFVNQTSMKCELCDELCGTCTEESSYCTSCTTFFTKNILSDLYNTCVDKCGLGTFYNKSDNVCSWCNPVCMLCDGHGANECQVCNKTPEGTQLYKYESQCVLSCPKNWVVNTDTNICQEKTIDFISFPYIFIAVCIVFVSLTTVISTFVSKFKNKFVDIIYALLSIAECLNRACLLGNLWMKSSVFPLAVCFMNMIATSAIGVFFNFLFMSPIFAHSPHFRTLNKQHSFAHSAATFFSYLSGVNIMRLLSSKFFGCQAFSSDYNDYKFYFQPLNTMANFTIIFSLAETAVCTYCLFQFTKFDEIFPLAAFGVVNNLIFVAIQLVKHFLVKAQITKYDRQQQQQEQPQNQQRNSNIRNQAVSQSSSPEPLKQKKTK